jgi:hypothetical protein
MYYPVLLEKACRKRTSSEEVPIESSNDRFARGRMDPVCANHNIGVGGRAVVELHFDTVPVLDQSDASMVKMKHAVRHCRGKNVEQFGAMEVIIRVYSLH